MDIKKIAFGSAGECNVLIEIPKGSPHKYEIDEASGYLKLDFVYKNGLTCPFNYGSIPNTLAGDGDPMDVIVYSTAPIAPNTVVSAKPFGIAKMIDRGDQDDKILAVLSGDELESKLRDISDFDDSEKRLIVDFFKEIAVQKNKAMEVTGFLGAKEAVEEINKVAKT